MKRKLVYLAIGLGLLPWLWAGSYVAIRMAAGSDGLCCHIRMPKWAAPLSESYRPLAKLDGKVTETQIVVHSTQ